MGRYSTSGGFVQRSTAINSRSLEMYGITPALTRIGNLKISLIGAYTTAEGPFRSVVVCDSRQNDDEVATTGSAITLVGLVLQGTYLFT